MPDARFPLKRFWRLLLRPFTRARTRRLRKRNLKPKLSMESNRELSIFYLASLGIRQITGMTRRERREHVVLGLYSNALLVTIV
jgi:hypothetical protein